MKNKVFTWPLLLVATLTLLLAGCKKDDTSDDSVSAEDNSSVATALDGTTDDAANIAGGIESLSGKTDAVMSVCGVTIDSSQKANGIIVINYDANANCNGISKSGYITITLLNYAGGTRWKDAGATLQMVFTNVKVTNTITGGNYTLNGTHYLTNTTGGLAYKIMNGNQTGTVTHKHSADNFTLTFGDGTTRTWSVRRSRSFSNDGTIRTVTLQGDTTINGLTGVQAWGTNRMGRQFTGAILTPIVTNSTCGLYKPVTGSLTHVAGARTATVVYGVDANGDVVTSGCPYGFKITYTLNNHTRTRVVQYWM